MNGAEPAMWLLLIRHIRLPTLPTMQLDRQQNRSEMVVSSASEGACSLLQEETITCKGLTSFLLLLALLLTIKQMSGSSSVCVSRWLLLLHFSGTHYTSYSTVFTWQRKVFVTFTGFLILK